MSDSKLPFSTFILCEVLGIHKYELVSDTQFKEVYRCSRCGKTKYIIKPQ